MPSDLPPYHAAATPASGSEAPSKVRGKKECHWSMPAKCDYPARFRAEVPVASQSLQEIVAVCAELAPILPGAACQEIRQSDELTIQLSLRIPGRSVWLELSSSPNLSRFLAISQRRSCLTPAPAFLARLRKELVGAKVASVEMPWLDRVVIVSFQRGGRMLHLVAELSAHHPNLFLTDDGLIILASIQPPSSHRRELLTGSLYIPPPHAEQGPSPLPAAQEAISDPNATVKASLKASLHLERRLAAELAAHSLQGQKRDLQQQLKKHVDKTARRVQNLEADLKKLGDPKELKRLGELLKANLGRFGRGPSVTLTDHYAEEPAQITVPLLPELDPVANMERYFHRFKRAQRGAAAVIGRLEESKTLLEKLQAQLQQLNQLSTPEELAQWTALFGSTAKQPNPSSQTKARKVAAPQRHQPYKTFCSASGRLILVGKGGADNHELTFRVSSPHDVWLHVRGFPGSHVVVPLARQQEIDPVTLADAAMLALHFSKAPNSGFNEVIWTRRKWVKALKGAPKGTVTLTQERNLPVDYDPSKIATLLATLQTDPAAP